MSYLFKVKMTEKESHLDFKKVLDLTHDESGCFSNISDARAISGKDIKFLLASHHKGKNYSFVFKSKTETLYPFEVYIPA